LQTLKPSQLKADRLPNKTNPALQTFDSYELLTTKLFFCCDEDVSPVAMPGDASNRPPEGRKRGASLIGGAANKRQRQFGKLKKNHA
jgi:hypothetical protein